MRMNEHRTHNTHTRTRSAESKQKQNEQQNRDHEHTRFAYNFMFIFKYHEFSPQLAIFWFFLLLFVCGDANTSTMAMAPTKTPMNIISVDLWNTFLNVKCVQNWANYLITITLAAGRFNSPRPLIHISFHFIWSTTTTNAHAERRPIDYYFRALLQRTVHRQKQHVLKRFLWALC